MIKPSIAELTQGNFNRYELVIGAAKCARRVTDEYVEQRARGERILVVIVRREKYVKMNCNPNKTKNER